MGMRIVISSALGLEEKEKVKVLLREMHSQHKIDISAVYDCEEHSTDPDKQRSEVDLNIQHADWFICLLPQDFVGKYTFDEVRWAYQVKHSGHPLVIRFFHAIEIPDSAKEVMDPARHRPLSELMECVKEWEGSDKDQYAVNYRYDQECRNLLHEVELEYEKCYYTDHVFYSQRLLSLAKVGAKVKPDEMFFDKARALPINGFDPDRYIYRQSVDELLRQELADPNRKFLFLTGKPSSGKSRAMLECCHSVLKDEQIVVIQKNNVQDICRKLLMEVQMQQAWEDGSWSRRPDGPAFQQQKYYFFCDQVRDVFEDVDDLLRRKFLSSIKKYENCRFIGSSTPMTLQEFVDNSKGIIALQDDGASIVNSVCITIPPVSKEPEVLMQLREYYATDNGETIGDFIPSLNNYKERIAQDVIKKVKDYKLLPELLQSLQAVETFRKSNPLLLALCVLRQLAERNEKQDLLKPKNVAECLKFLTRKNLLWLSKKNQEEGTTRSEVSVSPRIFGDFDTEDEVCYDDEWYPNIISPDYTFTFNELLWEYFQQKNNAQNMEVLFNLYNANDIQTCARVFFKSNPHASGLARIISRVPHRPGPADRRDFATRERSVWSYAHQQLKKLKLSSEPSPDNVAMVYNLLIGRAQNTDEVHQLLDEMKLRDIAVNDTTIGEMFRFASRRLERDSDEFKTFIRECYKLNEEQQRLSNTPWTFDDLYRIEREISLVYSNFRGAKDHTRNIIRRIISEDCDEHGLPLKGFDAVRVECAKNNTLYKMNVERLLLSLASLCRNSNDISELLALHRDCGLHPSTIVLHRIAYLIHNEDEIKALLTAVFPTVESERANRSLFERYVVAIVQHLTSFATSKTLYQKYYTDLGSSTHNPRLISMCLKNCKREEYQDAAAFVCGLPEKSVSGITYNTLLSNAPNIDDAIFILRKMPHEGMDEYTLSTCLNLVQKFLQIKGDIDAKNVNQGFLFAYEFINHPNLSPFRKSYACLQRLYDLADSKEREKYIDRLIYGPNGEQDDYFRLFYDNRINTTRINKEYRTFLDAYKEIYSHAYTKLCSFTGKVQPDLFSAICSKADATNAILAASEDSRIAEALATIRGHIEQRLHDATIIQDGYFFFNYHIKFCGKPLFNDDGSRMSPFFCRWFEGREGDADLMQMSLLSRIINWLYYKYRDKKMTVDDTWRRMRTLYDFYRRAFNRLRQPFLPHDKVFTLMLQIAIKSGEATENLNFLNRELCRLHIERTQPLNATIQQILKENSSLDLQYDKEHPMPHNRHMENIYRIKSSFNSERVLDVLQREVDLLGFVTPSILTCTLERYRDFQRAHAFAQNDLTEKMLNLLRKLTKKNGDKKKAWEHVNIEQLKNNYLEIRKQVRRPYGKLILPEEDKMVDKMLEEWSRCDDVENLKSIAERLKRALDTKQYNELTQFIEKNNLSDSLTQRAYALMALLAPTHEQRRIWLEAYDSMSTTNINEMSLGQLATELVISTYNIETSRKYFHKWLAIYEDIYPDIQVRCDQMPDKKWTTLGLHMKNELVFISKLLNIFKSKGHHEDNLSEFFEEYNLQLKPALETVNVILMHYALTDKCWMENNYPTTMTLKAVFQLLYLAFPNDTERLSSTESKITEKEYKCSIGRKNHQNKK